MRRAVRERFEKLEKSVEQAWVLLASLATIGSNFVTLIDGMSRRVGALEVDQAMRANRLEAALQAICPHAEIGCTQHHAGAGWVIADFECRICGYQVTYKAGQGGNMPQRFRDLLTAMGIEVPEKAES